MAADPSNLRAPWEVHPEIPEGSIHWRMGPGEDVMMAWWTSIRLLSPEERLRWREQHPPPQEWREWLESAIAIVEKEEPNQPSQPTRSARG